MGANVGRQENTENLLTKIRDVAQNPAGLATKQGEDKKMKSIQQSK